MEMTMPMTPANYGGNGGMFNGGNDWLAFLMFALIFGWGGNGFGGFGGRGSVPAAFNSGELLSDQFALQDIKGNQRHLDAGIRGLERGLCDSGYMMAQQNSQTRDMLSNATFGLERSINNLSAELASCCCNTQRAVDSVKYENAKNTCDIITTNNMNTRDLLVNQDKNTQRIIDLMTQSEISKLRDEKLALQGQLSQLSQTSTIIDALKPKAPIPSYIVPNPYCVG